MAETQPAEELPYFNATDLTFSKHNFRVTVVEADDKKNSRGYAFLIYSDHDDRKRSKAVVEAQDEEGQFTWFELQHDLETGRLYQGVETDRPSGPFWLHRPSRSGASSMLQIILWTNRDILDCLTILYTLSLYGNMLITAIIVLSLHRCMPLFYSFNIRLLYDRTSLLFC